MSAEQGTYLWLIDRLGHLTASSFADILPGPRGYKEARKTLMARLVAERLTEQPTETFQSPAMRWGTETEPLARDEWSARMGIEVEQVGFCRHPSIEWLGASPDGVCDDGYLLEIKCPNTATHINWMLAGEVPPEYRPQMWIQMYVTEAEACHFCSFDPRLPDNAQVFSRVFFFEQNTNWKDEIQAFLDETAELEKRIREWE